MDASINFFFFLPQTHECAIKFQPGLSGLLLLAAFFQAQ